jgi:hypothetical protein
LTDVIVEEVAGGQCGAIQAAQSFSVSFVLDSKVADVDISGERFSVTGSPG